MWRKSEDAKSLPQSASELKPGSNPPAAATVSHGVIIKGEVSGQGDFFLDGTFEGKVNLPEGSFIAGPHAHVTAEIEAREIIVLGEVVGTLKAHERVHISSTGRLTGDMDTRGIVIEDGAVLHSKVANPRAVATEPRPPKAAAQEAAPESTNALPEVAEPAEPSSPPKESLRGKGATASGDS